jgi:hypothetical protein
MWLCVCVCVCARACVCVSLSLSLSIYVISISHSLCVCVCVVWGVPGTPQGTKVGPGAAGSVTQWDLHGWATLCASSTKPHLLTSLPTCINLMHDDQFCESHASSSTPCDMTVDCSGHLSGSSLPCGGIAGDPPKAARTNAVSLSLSLSLSLFLSLFPSLTIALSIPLRICSLCLSVPPFPTIPPSFPVSVSAGDSQGHVNFLTLSMHKVAEIHN